MQNYKIGKVGTRSVNTCMAPYPLLVVMSVMPKSMKVLRKIKGQFSLLEMHLYRQMYWPK